MRIVYDANNSLDAHVVKNLLETEGIEAFIQGEHLQSGVGELSAINLVKVSVHDADVVRAREIIKEWDSQEVVADQRQSYATSHERVKSKSNTFFVFMLGCTAGILATYINFTTPVTYEGTDFNRDGLNDEIYTYKDGRMSKFEADTNLDGRVDYIVDYDSRGLAESGKYDIDYNGNYDSFIAFRRNFYRFVKRDLNEDSEIDVIEEYENGNLVKMTYFDLDTGLHRKHLHYKHNKLIAADLDSDADGLMDYKINYDDYDEEISRSPIP